MLRHAAIVVPLCQQQQRLHLVHCPRAVPGWVKAIFAGPDPDPVIFRSELIFYLFYFYFIFFKCFNFDILVDFYVFVK